MAGQITIPKIGESQQGSLLTSTLPTLLYVLLRPDMEKERIAHEQEQAASQQAGLEDFLRAKQPQPAQVPAPGANPVPTAGAQPDTSELGKLFASAGAQPGSENYPALSAMLNQTPTQTPEDVAASQQKSDVTNWKQGEQYTPYTENILPKNQSRQFYDLAAANLTGLRPTSTPVQLVTDEEGNRTFVPKKVGAVVPKAPAPLVQTTDESGNISLVPKKQGVIGKKPTQYVTFTDEQGITRVTPKQEGVLGKKFVAPKGFQPTSVPGISMNKDNGKFYDSSNNQLSTKDVQDLGLTYNENKPTETTKTMQQMAPKVLDLISDARTLIPKVALGPAAGRYADIMTNKVGAPDADYKKLSTTIGLLETSLMRMHVGARGGVKLMDHFHAMMDVGRQSPENLQASLDAIEEYARSVEKPMTRQPLPGQQPASAPTPTTGYSGVTSSGNKYTLVPR